LNYIVSTGVSTSKQSPLFLPVLKRPRLKRHSIAVGEPVLQVGL